MGPFKRKKPREGAIGLSNDLLRCVNLVTCRSRPLDQQSPAQCALFLENLVWLCDSSRATTFPYCDRVIVTRQNHNNNPFNPVSPSLERTLLFTISAVNEASSGPCLLVCAANILPPSSGREEASKLLPTIVGEYEAFV